MPRLPLLAATLLLVAAALAGCQNSVPPPPPPPPPTAAECLETGKKALQAGDAAKARQSLKEAVRLDPRSAEAFLYLGLAAAGQHDPEQAEAAFSRATVLSPDAPRPLEALGILQYEQKRYDLARQTLNRAGERNSPNPQVYYYLGNIAMFEGNCPAAFDAYRKAMAKDPDYAPAVQEYHAAVNACAKMGK